MSDPDYSLDRLDRLRSRVLATEDSQRAGAQAALIAAIRTFTVDLQHDGTVIPNGDAERSMIQLQGALHNRHLNDARRAAANLLEALARDVKALRLAAEAYFGIDFRLPSEEERENCVLGPNDRAACEARSLDAIIAGIVTTKSATGVQCSSHPDYPLISAESLDGEKARAACETLLRVHIAKAGGE